MINRKTAWLLFDAASAAYPTLILTFVFSVYFTDVIATNKIEGAAQWSLAIGLSGAVIAVLAPVVGFLTDRMGRIRCWLILFLYFCCASSVLLYGAAPQSSVFTPFIILIIIGLGNIAFELSQVLYNRTLPLFSDPATVGIVSGQGWGSSLLLYRWFLPRSDISE